MLRFLDCGDLHKGFVRVRCHHDCGHENLARYIIRAAFSQESMTYIPASSAPDGRAKVIYQSENGRERKVFPALDWLAQLITHMPNLETPHRSHSNLSVNM
ncbi:MAG: hypothetical protein SWH68_17370 [Thermodesulfobacteriota bacterium]|nr:hypothetical protein [Thermodesulfobacteriota bacterium]